MTDITGSWFEAHWVSRSTQDLYCGFFRCLPGAYFHQHLLRSVRNLFKLMMSRKVGNDPIAFGQETSMPQTDRFPALLHLAQTMLLYVIFCAQSETGSSFCSVIFNQWTDWQSFVVWRLCKLQEDFIIIPDGREGSLMSPHVILSCDVSSRPSRPMWPQLWNHTDQIY